MGRVLTEFYFPNTSAPDFIENFSKLICQKKNGMILILFLKIFYIMNNSNIFAPIYQQLSGCLSPLECNRIRLNWFNKLFINLLHI